MHTLFALFDRPDDVAAAIRELETLGTPSNRCTIAVHKDRLEDLPSSETPLFETAAASTFARGTLLGGVLGAIAGALAFGPLGLVAAGPLAGTFFGLAAGAASGAYVGSISGASDVDPTFKRMAKEIERGAILLAVEPPSIDAAERAESMLNRHHGRVVHRHVLRPPTADERGNIDGPAA